MFLAQAAAGSTKQVSTLKAEKKELEETLEKREKLLEAQTSRADAMQRVSDTLKERVESQATRISKLEVR